MYRLAVELFDPFVLSFFLLGLAVAGLWRDRQASRTRSWLVTAAFAALVLACMPPVAFLALGTLEWAYPPRYDLPTGAQAIVLLAGMVAPPDEFQPRPVLSDETVTRCLKAAELYRESGPRLIVVSGGKVDSSQPGPTCARAMADFLMGLGVEPRDLVTEERSRTTHENAVETARLLAARGIQHIVLVTSATHLRRAERCFRAQGLEVTARGCGHRATEFPWSVRSFLPSSHAAASLQAVVHEWIGLAWYRLRGRL